MQMRNGCVSLTSIGSCDKTGRQTKIYSMMLCSLEGHEGELYGHLNQAMSLADGRPACRTKQAILVSWFFWQEHRATV